VLHRRTATDFGKLRHAVVFDDPVEMLDMVCEAGAAGQFDRYLGPPANVFGSRDMLGGYRDPVAWYGRTDLKSWPDLRAKALELWPPGVARVNRLTEKLAARPFAPPRDLRRRATWRDDGEGDFDLDRFVDGRPAWRGPRRREVIGRQFLTFVVDVAANAEVSADSMYWRAAVAIAAARILEEYGYGVEVLAASNAVNVLHPPAYTVRNAEAADANDLAELGSEGEWGRWGPRRPRLIPVPDGERQDVFSAVWVKRPDDPIDVGMMAAVCSPWFFRLAFFGMWGLIPGGLPRFTLGQAIDLETPQLDDVCGGLTPADGDRDRVVLADVWNENRAAALLTQTLKRYADPDWLADQPAGG
jgi:hypothetical protein